MLLHCASRLGFVSYMYQQRHEIAFSLGLTAEKVIAMCNSNYHKEIKFAEHHSGNETTTLPHDQEINLFFVVNVVCFPPYSSEADKGMSFYHYGRYSSPPPDIFHPPLV